MGKGATETIAWKVNRPVGQGEVGSVGRTGCGGCRAATGLVAVGFRVVAALGMVIGSAADLPPSASRAVDFEKDVRPLFVTHCFECHDARKQKSGYRLDLREVAFKGGESGSAAILPGNSADSPLIQFVSGLKPDMVMPAKGPRLGNDEIGVLRKWIDDGAPWPAHLSGEVRGRNHWAFRPPVHSEAPAVEGDWARNAVDRFLLARMKAERLKPSPEADRITLLRRLSLDLVGLPPTIAEADAYLADRAEGAYERQVERLLASPHFGERWTRLWLDAARFADSNGFEKDRPREMGYYRDWVIRAFNQDMPYDRFLREQLAGDLVPGADQDSIVATGFLRNSMINEEGAIDPEQFRMDSMFDRMDCVGKSVLGLTIQCAQCHTHKYDPLTQEEYYRLFAFLNDDDELTTAVYGPDDRRRIAEIRSGTERIEGELKTSHPDWADRMAAWEATVRDEPVAWTVLEPFEYGDPGGLSKLALQADGSLLAGGHRFSGGTWRVKVKTALTNIAAIRLEVLRNGNLPIFGPGRSREGGFALREFRLKVAPEAGGTNETTVRFVSATADYSAPQNPGGKIEKDKDYSGPVELAIDGNEKTSWTIDAGPGRRNADRKAVFSAGTNIALPAGSRLTFELVQHDEIGCFRLSAAPATNAVADLVPREVRTLLSIPRERRTPEQTAVVFGYWRTTVNEFAQANARIDELWRGFPAFKETALVLHRREKPRDTRLLRRGDWLKPAHSVKPGVPAFLNPLPAEGTPTRLTLARWITSPQAPTTARVYVNRIWQAVFGLGLVATPEDFGVQGEHPSHPELLDWLASEFMNPTVPDPGGVAASPWSTKHLLRLIVGASAYRQQSVVTAGAREVDPYNRLLARGARFRVDGELVRDITLQASGLLNPAVGGPSLYAPAPAFLFEPPTSYSPFPWKDVTGADRYRRALYTFRRRSTPYPMLQTFDTPNGDAACVRRLRSNTPLQALTSLNETLFVECAQALALRTVREGGQTDEQRIVHAFRRVLSRPPSEREKARLAELLAKQKQYIADGWVNALDLSTGRNQLPEGLPVGVTPTELAAYVVVSRVLLNLDETITRE